MKRIATNDDLGEQQHPPSTPSQDEAAKSSASRSDQRPSEDGARVVDLRRAGSVALLGLIVCVLLVVIVLLTGVDQQSDRVLLFAAMIYAFAMCLSAYSSHKDRQNLTALEASRVKSATEDQQARLSATQSEALRTARQDFRYHKADREHLLAQQRADLARRLLTAVHTTHRLALYSGPVSHETGEGERQMQERAHEASLETCVTLKALRVEARGNNLLEDDDLALLDGIVRHLEALVTWGRKMTAASWRHDSDTITQIQGHVERVDEELLGDIDRLEAGLGEIFKQSSVELEDHRFVWPVQPNTRSAIERQGISVSSVERP